MKDIGRGAGRLGQGRETNSPDRSLVTTTTVLLSRRIFRSLGRRWPGPHAGLRRRRRRGAPGLRVTNVPRVPSLAPP